MSKQDFELIARVLADLARNAENVDGTTLVIVANRMADELARQNPRFDRARFVKACAVYGPQLARA